MKLTSLLKKWSSAFQKSLGVGMLASSSLLPFATVSSNASAQDYDSYFPPVIVVPGINQTCESWSWVTDQLQPLGYPVTCIDLPNKGHNGWEENKKTIDTALSQIPDGPVALMGYSLGAASEIKYLEENPAFAEKHKGSTWTLLDPATQSSMGSVLVNPLLRPIVGAVTQKVSPSVTERELTGTGNTSFLQEVHEGYGVLGKSLAANKWETKIVSLGSLIVDGESHSKMAEAFKQQGANVMLVNPAGIMNDFKGSTIGNAGVFPQGSDVGRAEMKEYFGAHASHIAEFQSQDFTAAVHGFMLDQVPASSHGKDQIASLDTGGVDFRNFTLAYLNETDINGARCLSYAFRANPSKGKGIAVESAAKNSIDAFLNMVLLPHELFWVNLNPAEPNRIIDDRLRDCEFARIMLHADVDFKKAIASLTDPRASQAGRDLWDEMAKQQKMSLMPFGVEFRVWALPGEIAVYENGEEFYITKAEIDVQLESEYLQSQGVRMPAVNNPSAIHMRDYMKEKMIPSLKAMVNEDPMFAPLREVFYGRIMAEWYGKHQSIDGLFSNSVSKFGIFQQKLDEHPIKSRVPWDPKQIFDEYVKSFKEGEYNFSESTRSGSLITTRRYFLGGVDFTKISYKVLGNRIPEPITRTLSSSILSPLGSDYEGQRFYGGLLVAQTIPKK